jgi:hypothetical protein
LEKSGAPPCQPHRGHRIEAKKRPHKGHLSAIFGTSAPQLSQKKRGDFFTRLF